MSGRRCAGTPLRFGAIMVLALVLVSATDCGERAEERADGSAREDAALHAKTFPLDNPTSVVGFGGGSLWATDLGDYRCDDTPGIEASCSSPGRVYLRRIDPETREVLATVPLRGADYAAVAFGAGAAWVAHDNYSSPSKSGALRWDLDSNRITHRIRVRGPTAVTVAENAVWVTSALDGTVSRIDPENKKLVDEVEVGAGANGVTAGKDAGWIASWGPSGGSRTSEGKELIRLDPETNEIVARIPIEKKDLEGGAIDVATGAGAVWVASVNGKLLRVDPATNKIVATIDLGDYSFDVETGAGAVWATSEVNVNAAKGYTQRLTRVDPDSNGVSGTLDLDDLSGLTIVDGDAWLGRGNIGKMGRGGLTKVKP